MTPFRKSILSQMIKQQLNNHLTKQKLEIIHYMDIATINSRVLTRWFPALQPCNFYRKSSLLLVLQAKRSKQLKTTHLNDRFLPKRENFAVHSQLRRIEHELSWSNPRRYKIGVGSRIFATISALKGCQCSKNMRISALTLDAMKCWNLLFWNGFWVIWTYFNGLQCCNDQNFVIVFAFISRLVNKILTFSSYKWDSEHICIPSKHQQNVIVRKAGEAAHIVHLLCYFKFLYFNLKF